MKQLSFKNEIAHLRISLQASAMKQMNFKSAVGPIAGEVFSERVNRVGVGQLRLKNNVNAIRCALIADNSS